MSVINTNITAMIGQQNLSQSQSALSTSMERLSSGLKINSAADDAAGQAIANRMSSQINGLSQAQSNANDGISIAQTAEGALNQINDNVQRVRELTVQAQNGTNSGDDLQSIQDEIDQRTAEIDRISDETNFNGVKVLSENSDISIQVGANDGESISVNLQQTNSSTLGIDSLDVAQLPSTASASDLDADATSMVIDDSDGNTLEGAKVIQNADDEFFIQTKDGDLFTTGAVTTDADDVATIAADDADAMTDTDLADSGAAPLANLDNALKTVDGFRSDLGAIQNRFDSAITNLQTNETNLTSARSRIEDADYADEVSNMTKNQILQQAGTSVLSQANQLPQNALSLLG